MSKDAVLIIFVSVLLQIFIILTSICFVLTDMFVLFNHALTKCMHVSIISARKTHPNQTFSQMKK